MNLPMKLVVPGAPVAKGRPRISTVAGKARAFTPSKTRHYESAIGQAGYRSMEGADPLDQPLHVTITAYVQMPKSLSKANREKALAGTLLPTTKPDVDNYAKAAIDGLNGIVFRDDSVVTDLFVRKRYAAAPRLEIFIEAA